MDKKMMLGKHLIGLALVMGLCLALAAPVQAGRGGMGGGFSGMGGGFKGGGFQASGFQGSGFRGASFQGQSFHHGFHRCCVNGAFVNGFVFGSFPAPVYYGYPASPYPLYLDPMYSPGIQSLTPQLDLNPSFPREACYVTGCYRLQGDGVNTAFQWIWVPAPPSPPAPPSVIPYPNGRYELRGPSRWEWIPNPSSGPSQAPPAPPAALRAPEAGAPAVSGLYRWTDENGVTHWTQGVDAVPERYRSRSKPGSAPDGML